MSTHVIHKLTFNLKPEQRQFFDFKVPAEAKLLPRVLIDAYKCSVYFHRPAYSDAPTERTVRIMAAWTGAELDGADDLFNFDPARHSLRYLDTVQTPNELIYHIFQVQNDPDKTLH